MIWTESIFEETEPEDYFLVLYSYSHSAIKNS